MSRLLLTAAVLAVLVYTMVLGVRWLSPRIEQDIAGRVNTGLAEQGLLWADVAVNGRDVELSGVAPDAEAKAKALDVAAHVFGVSKVQDNLSVAGEVSGTAVSGTVVTMDSTREIAEEAKAAGLYTLQIAKDGDAVVLSGNVPDEASKDVLVKLAETHYGAGNVKSDDLKVVKGAPAGWRSAVGAVLMHIANMEHASVMISGTEVMVSGTVLDQQFSDKMEQAVEQVLPKSYKVAFAVEVVTPTEVAPAAGDASATVTSGCDDMKLVKQERLHFGFDKAELTKGHEGALKRVAKAMDGCTSEHLVVAGYTDITGSSLYNKWLSQQRAEAGMRGLMRDGVAHDRLQAVGYGEAYPIASNKTMAGRKQNRRVEFSPGSDLPHPVVKLSKAAAKPAAKKAAAKSGKTQIKVIDKPWWAKPYNDKDGKAMNHKVEGVAQPQPVLEKQPSMGAGKNIDEHWLGDE
jgi:outer membrane protein OmpA-like peptidoglycan-associated protein